MNQPAYPLHQPRTIEELAELVREAKVVRVGAGRSPLFAGTNRFTAAQRRHIAARRALVTSPSEESLEGTESEFASSLEILEGETHIDFTELSGVVDYSPSDQVITVLAGTLIGGRNGREGRFQTTLAGEAQCLPLPYLDTPAKALLNGLNTAVGLGLSRNLPHAGEGQHGNWRDWVLGMTLVLADGTIVRSGAKVVKSVAGFDAHRLMIGAFDQLAVVASVTLRTLPIAAQKPLTVVTSGDFDPAAQVRIQRVRRTDLDGALAKTARPIAWDPETATIWSHPTEAEFIRWPYDLVWHSEEGSPLSPAAARLFAQAKAQFDPEGKLNP